MAALEPLFTFGVVADIQYSDKDDTWMEDRNQRYRETPAKWEAAVKQFLSQQPSLSCVLTLGDIVDGNTSLEGIPVYHTIGNHCLSVPREKLLQRLHIPPTSYFAASLGHGWRLVVLDTTEMSPHSGYPEDHPLSVECRAYKAAHPIEEYPQMSNWNGGVSSSQLAWLRAELAAADAAHERVIVTSHHPIGTGCGRLTHSAWNGAEIEAVLLQDRTGIMVESTTGTTDDRGMLPQSKSFTLAFNGHDHPGGYACNAGRHFVGLEAVLESPTDGNAYAIVKVFSDHIVIEGHGDVTSRTLQLS